MAMTFVYKSLWFVVSRVNTVLNVVLRYRACHIQINRLWPDRHFSLVSTLSTQQSTLAVMYNQVTRQPFTEIIECRLGEQ